MIETNLDYIENLKRLKNFILVRYADDDSIVPKESVHFGYVNINKKPLMLEDMDIYKMDKLGLKSMKENGKLKFLVSPGAHLYLDNEWFTENIIPYLKET